MPSDEMVEKARVNTDTTLWSTEGPPFVEVHVTKDGGVGINVSGNVMVKPAAEWQRAALTAAMGEEKPVKVGPLAHAVCDAYAAATGEPRPNGDIMHDILARLLPAHLSREDVVEEALEFYADASRWREYAQDQADSAFDRNTGSEFGGDEGQKARDALTAIRKLKERS